MMMMMMMMMMTIIIIIIRPTNAVTSSISKKDNFLPMQHQLDLF